MEGAGGRARHTQDGCRRHRQANIRELSSSHSKTPYLWWGRAAQMTVTQRMGRDRELSLCCSDRVYLVLLEAA